MNSRSKILALAALLVLGCVVSARTEDLSGRLFETVSAQDGVYAQLRQLVDAGLLDKSDAASPLTRYDVARSIQKAQVKYDAIVVAMNAADVPPPPDDGKPLPEAGSISDAADTASESSAVEPVTEISIEDAAATLHSLEEAYQFELKALKDHVQALKDKVDDLETKQYAVHKKIKSLLYAPEVSIHGLGRAFGWSQEYFGPASGAKADRVTSAYLDLMPEGTLSKELFWSTCLRIQSSFLPSADTQLSLRRIAVQFNPPWLSLWACDFEEAYTPLTLWNRNTLDLAFTPDMMARQDQREKYEGYLDHEPDLPFRGLKVGTGVMWPDSKILEGVSVSSFAHMIRNGLDDMVTTSSGWFFGPHQYMNWIFAGTCEVKSAKWWVGEKYLQFTADGYGALLNQLLGTDAPGSSYVVNDPTTWAHGYQVGSVKPNLKLAWGNGRAVGVESEFAFSKYIDDERDPSNKTVSDYALIGGPYVRFGESKLSLLYHDVGPYYYSPMAQTRQDAVTSTAALSASDSPDMYGIPLHTQNFLTGLSRPGGIFTFYDRTLDNTFPYGLATPNRRGFGGDIDVAALPENAFKLKGSAYCLQEISGDLTFNQAQTGYVPVDDPDGSIATPKRKFIYANVGPSYNLGPALHLNRVVEIGANGRFERTDSSIGRLDSLWVLGSLRVGVLRFWDISTAAYQLKSNGVEAGMDGTTWARYSYLFDNEDLGSYSAIQVDRQVRSLRVSNQFRFNSHADLFLDWAWTETKDVTVLAGATRVCNQYFGLTYEVRF